MKILYGDRIGAQGVLNMGTSAIIYDATHQKILLTRRSDNGRWCIPGGRMEVGESVSEACIREIHEETGLQVKIKRLVGIYSSPHMLLEYADGNRYQVVNHSFEAETTGGQLGLSDETTEVGYFSPSEILQMDVLEHHLQRIQDALANQPLPVIQ
ncbi:NUDIX hydrolase [Dictyobacter kobayashii]|uniref:NUDIX hydrolase n=2 Tax=Dictyobacter kobayashii TaxID=2014872 RepID=A0A402AE61_9CHLR|nr:NUDIX hydrolase [Dictyobacter kobayashii]